MSNYDGVQQHQVVSTAARRRHIEELESERNALRVPFWLCSVSSFYTASQLFVKGLWI